MSNLLSYSKIAGYEKCPASAFASELLSNIDNPVNIKPKQLAQLGLPANIKIELIERHDTEATVYGKIGHELLQTKLTQVAENEHDRFTTEEVLFLHPEYDKFALTPMRGNVKKKFKELADVADMMIDSLRMRQGGENIFRGKVEQHWEYHFVHGYIDYIMPESGTIVDFKFLSEAQTFEGEEWWKPYELQAQIYSLLNFMENVTTAPVLYQAYIKKTKEILYHEFEYDIEDLVDIATMLLKTDRHIEKLREKDFLWRCDHPFCQYCRQTREIVYRDFYPEIGLEHLTR